MTNKKEFKVQGLTREEVIEKYKEFLTDEELENIRNIIVKGKDLEPEIVDMVNRKFSKLLLKLD
jgi:hypothetical protein